MSVTVRTCESCTNIESFTCQTCLAPLCDDHTWTDGKGTWCANCYESRGGNTNGEVACDEQGTNWRTYWNLD